jgi:Membrane domain of glycerophosphoryl diester phosphodiesterase
MGKNMEQVSFTAAEILNRLVAMVVGNFQLAMAGFIVLTGLGIASDLLPEAAGVGLSFASAAASVYFQTTATKSALANASVVIPLDMKVGSFVSVFLVSLVTSAGILAGAVLLVIPAFILAARWSIAVPIVVTTDQGVMTAISKSWHLTKAHTLPIMGSVIIVSLPLIVAIGLAIVDATNGTGLTEAPLGSTMLQVAISISTVSGWYLAVAIYERVNGNSETLSDIFA